MGACRQLFAFMLFLWPYSPQFCKAPLCLPTRVAFLYKVKMWKVVFDITFYIQALSGQLFDPWCIKESYSWHLKLGMALWSLFSIRKVRLFCRGPYWNCARLGVLTSPFGAVEDLWQDWTAR